MNSSMNKELAKSVENVVGKILEFPFFKNQKEIYDVLMDKVAKHLLAIGDGYQVEHY